VDTRECPPSGAGPAAAATVAEAASRHTERVVQRAGTSAPHHSDARFEEHTAARPAEFPMGSFNGEVLMTRFRVVLTLAVVFVFAGMGAARADEAPAGATGRCKDGSYTESASKRGACKGHGGVAEWLAPQGSASSEKAKAKSEKSATASAAQAAPSAPPADATGKCKDGSYTTSASKKGACRGHGGVAEWTGSAATSTPAAPSVATAPPATPKATSKAAATASSAPAAKTASNTDPTGATALCKDGTYSHSQHHTGTCSHHGGVSQWLGQQQ